jgi:hypothetical protein
VSTATFTYLGQRRELTTESRPLLLATFLLFPQRRFCTMSTSSIASDLDVQDGLCVMKPIVGKEFIAVPKGFESKKLSTCVFREKHMTDIVAKLQDAMEEICSPGVYIQGPMGAGKSVITYMISQYVKFHLNWLTIYVPNCGNWTNLDGAAAAKGFFLDRVVERHCQTKMSDIVVFGDDYETSGPYGFAVGGCCRHGCKPSGCQHGIYKSSSVLKQM